MSGWSEEDIPRLDGLRALVTGGASGIGADTARALAEHGARVIIADRDEAGAKATAGRIGRGVEVRPLDLSSLAEVRRFAEGLLSEGGKIDLLINNAGIQPLSERRLSADGYELTFAIGHLGHFLLTALLWPLLEASEAARVVTVSSMVHSRGSFDWDDLQMERGYSSQRPYNQTKLANLLFARELQRRLEARSSPVRSLAAHPGVARTSIGDNRARLGRYHLGDYAVSAILRVVMPVLGQPASMGALPTLYAATSPEAKGGGFCGPQGFGGMKGPPGPVTPKLPADELSVARRLWEVSERLTGTSFFS